jgi:hypothetical protein
MAGGWAFFPRGRGFPNRYFGFAAAIVVFPESGMSETADIMPHGETRFCNVIKQAQ